MVDRTYSWASLGQVGTLSFEGLDGYGQMRAIAAADQGAVPIAATLGLSEYLVEHGQVTVRMPVAEFHYNPLGRVHGGVIAFLLDTAAGCSVHSTLTAEESYTSLDLTTKYLKPVTLESGLLTCVGKVIQRGRRTALAESQLFDENQKLLAHATSSCIIMR